MKKKIAATSLFLLALLNGCAVLEDNGTRLAFALENAANGMLESGTEELELRYQPKAKHGNDYVVHMLRSKHRTSPYGGYITVSGEDGGGTSHQQLIIYIPKELHVAKNGEATFITLKNVGGRIEVVGLR